MIDNHNTFINDKPIESIEEDKLGRENFAHSLAEAICQRTSTDSYVVGLYGSWGSGKSSIINMVRESLEKSKNKPIVIHFNPWMYSNIDYLITNFLKHMSLCLEKKYGFDYIAEQIMQYSIIFEALSFTSPYIGIIAQLSKIIRIRHKEEKNLDHIKKELDNLFKKNEQKIVIVLDDIDRLMDDEIQQIFRLIKMVANFPNTIYLVAFDPIVVSKSLSKTCQDKGEEYLEKIIQVPFRVPEISEDEIKKYFIDEIIQLFTNEKMSEKRYEDFEHFYDTTLKHLFSTLRDVKRYLNTFKFRFTALKHDINIYDLLIITGLKLYLPDLFDWIYFHKAIVTGNYGFKIKEQELQGIKEELDNIFDKKEDKVPLKVQLSLLGTLFLEMRRYINTHYKDDNKEGFFMRQANESCRISVSYFFDIYFRLDLLPNMESLKETKIKLEELSKKRQLIKNIIKNSWGNFDLTFFSKVLHVIYNNELSPTQLPSILNAFIEAEKYLIAMNNENALMDSIDSEKEPFLGFSEGFYLYNVVDLLVRINVELFSKIEKQIKFEKLKTALTNFSLGLLISPLVVKKISEMFQEGYTSQHKHLKPRIKELQEIILTQIMDNKSKLLERGFIFLPDRSDVIELLTIWQKWGNAKDVEIFTKELLKKHPNIILFIGKKLMAGDTISFIFEEDTIKYMKKCVSSDIFQEDNTDEEKKAILDFLEKSEKKQYN